MEPMQRKLALQSFMGGHGYKLFQEEMGNLEVWAEVERKKMEDGFITESGLSRLNYILGIKQGLERVQCVLSGVREELENPVSNSPDMALTYQGS